MRCKPLILIFDIKSEYITQVLTFYYLLFQTNKKLLFLNSQNGSAGPVSLIKSILLEYRDEIFTSHLACQHMLLKVSF